MPSSSVYHHSPLAERLLSSPEDGSQSCSILDHEENGKQPVPEADDQHHEGHLQGLPNASGAVAPLLQFPDEILVSIMQAMPYSSLYMLRQSCRTFRNLVDDHVFKDFQSEILQDECRSSCITRDGFNQLRLIRNMLRRRTLCHACGQKADSGELDQRLTKLWKKRFCSGCMLYHPRIFFSSDKRDRSCLGRLGVLELCSTYKISGSMLLTWESQSPRRLAGHQGYTADSDRGKWVPALNLIEPYAFIKARGTCMSLLTKLPSFRPTSISSLESSLRDVFRDPRFGCKHLPSLIGTLLSSMTPDDCKCFPPDGIPAPWLANLFGMRSAAKRLAAICRNHKFTCQACAVNYTLLRDGNKVFLQVDLLPFFPSPVSPAWLSRLSFARNKNPILGKSTEGVLWCRDPFCGTGSGSRWLKMLDVAMSTPPESFRGTVADFQRRDCLTNAEMQLSLEMQSYERHASSKQRRRIRVGHAWVYL